MLPAPVPFLRHVALAEAVSWMILLGIAMPLKCLFHQPGAVKITGALHGLLFVVFCLALLRVLVKAPWPFSRCLLIFAASFIPLLPFFLDRKMKDWENH
jgi:integral membrane protein